MSDTRKLLENLKDANKRANQILLGLKNIQTNYVQETTSIGSYLKDKGLDCGEQNFLSYLEIKNFILDNDVTSCIETIKDVSSAIKKVDNVVATLSGDC